PLLEKPTGRQVALALVAIGVALAIVIRAGHQVRARIAEIAAPRAAANLEHAKAVAAAAAFRAVSVHAGPSTATVDGTVEPGPLGWPATDLEPAVSYAVECMAVREETTMTARVSLEPPSAREAAPFHCAWLLGGYTVHLDPRGDDTSASVTVRLVTEFAGTTIIGHW